MRLMFPAKGRFREGDRLLPLTLGAGGNTDAPPLSDAAAWKLWQDVARHGASAPQRPVSEATEAAAVGGILPPLPPPSARPAAGACGLVRAAAVWRARVAQHSVGGRSGGSVRLWLAPAAGGPLRPVEAMLCVEEGAGGEDVFWF